jgi:uncharacterized membrane protein YedE/YeeE
VVKGGVATSAVFLVFFFTVFFCFYFFHLVFISVVQTMSGEHVDIEKMIQKTGCHGEYENLEQCMAKSNRGFAFFINQLNVTEKKKNQKN